MSIDRVIDWNSYDTGKFFVVRTPLLPLETLTWLLDVPQGSKEEPDQWEPSRIRRAERLLIEKLTQLLAEPVFQEALCTASETFSRRIEQWTPGNDFRNDQKILLALLRYCIRMATRPTPFGLLAGLTIGEFGPCSLIELGPTQDYKKHIQPDIELLRSAVNLARSRTNERITYTLCPTFCETPTHFKFIGKSCETAGCKLTPLRIRRTPILERVVQEAQLGTTRSVLMKTLAAEQLTIAAAKEVLQRLVESNFLVDSFNLTACGEMPVSRVLHNPEFAHLTSRGRRFLQQLSAWCNQMSSQPGFSGSKSYRACIAHCMAQGLTLNGNHFHVQLFKPAKRAVLARDVANRVARAAAALFSIPSVDSILALREFAEQFEARYGDQEVPLLQAVDSEFGIGFGDRFSRSPLIQGLSIPDSPEPLQSDALRDEYLIRKLEDFYRKGKSEIEVTDRELATISPLDAPKLPESFAALITLFRLPSNEELERHAPVGETTGIVLHSVVGPCSTAALSRFGLGQLELRERLREVASCEVAVLNDAIVAELDYMPAGRAGNVAARPTLLKHSINLTGRPTGRDGEVSIPLSELYVSVVNTKILLRWSREDRYVICRSNSTFNYNSESSPLYRFLYELQFQSQLAAVWNWGTLRALPYLPRVRYQDVVLSPARWRIQGTDLNEFGQSDSATLFAASQRLRRRWRLPRHLLLVSGDARELLIDFNNPFCAQILANVARTVQNLELIEPIGLLDDAFVTGPEGSFTNEVIIPFISKNAKSLRTNNEGVEAFTQPLRHIFPPGSEWVYFRLYSSEGLIDFLLDKVGTAINDMLINDWIDRWFFVRYSDTENHLRLRFHLKNMDRLTEVLDYIRDSTGEMLEQRWLSKLEIGTYKRELSRYGGATGIEIAERFFHYDSESAVTLLRIGDMADDDELRWQVAALSVDRFMADIGLDMSGKAGTMERMYSLLSNEFILAKEVLVAINDRYRRYRNVFEEIVGHGANVVDKLAQPREVFDRRSQAFRLIGASLRDGCAKGRISIALEDFVCHLIHMNLNRLLIADHRRVELVLYGFMMKTYQSYLKRGHS